MKKNRNSRIQKREVILNAAKVAFAEKGFDAALLQEIADRADLAKGTLYLYFKSKEDLFLSLIEDELGKFIDIVETVSKESCSSIEKIKMLIENVLSHLEANKEFFCIFTPGRAGFTKIRHPKMAERIIPKHRKEVNLTAQIIKEGVREGMIKNLDPTLLAYALIGLIHMMIGKWLLDGQKFSLEKSSEIVTTIFLDGIKTDKEKKATTPTGRMAETRRTQRKNIFKRISEYKELI